MPSFTGVSLITDGKNCTTSAIDAGTDRGYHLLVVKGYSRTVQETPNGKYITSGPFMVGGHQWCIRYYPNGCALSSADFITLDLHLVADIVEMEEGVKVNLEFSFIDQVEYQKPIRICATEPRCFTNKVPNWGYETFMKRDVLERSAHLKADCFTIRCDIMVCNDLNPQQDAVGTLANIGQHLKILLKDKLGSDVTFEVSNETFPAHRCMLAARSKVFKAQLFGPMTEGITFGVIQIKDMKPKVFAALLSFIYTDAFPSMDAEEGEDDEEEGQEEKEEGQEDEAAEPVRWLQWLQDLFVAADIYDIQQLKFLCEMKLSEHIGVSSVASTLALAEQHQCHGLKEVCLKFIQVLSTKRLDKVMETDGFEHLATTHLSVLKEIMAKLASNPKTDKKRKR